MATVWASTDSTAVSDANNGRQWNRHDGYPEDKKVDEDAWSDESHDNQHNSSNDDAKPTRSHHHLEDRPDGWNGRPGGHLRAGRPGLAQDRQKTVMHVSGNRAHLLLPPPPPPTHTRRQHSTDSRRGDAFRQSYRSISPPLLHEASHGSRTRRSASQSSSGCASADDLKALRRPRSPVRVTTYPETSARDKKGQRHSASRSSERHASSRSHRRYDNSHYSQQDEGERSRQRASSSRSWLRHIGLEGLHDASWKDIRSRRDSQVQEQEQDRDLTNLSDRRGRSPAVREVHSRPRPNSPSSRSWSTSSSTSPPPRRRFFSKNRSIDSSSDRSNDKKGLSRAVRGNSRRRSESVDENHHHHERHQKHAKNADRSQNSKNMSSTLEVAARNALRAGTMAALSCHDMPGGWLGDKGACVATAALGSAIVDTYMSHRHPNSVNGIRHTALRKAAEYTIRNTISGPIKHLAEEEKQKKRHENEGKRHKAKKEGRKGRGKRGSG